MFPLNSTPKTTAPTIFISITAIPLIICPSGKMP